MRHFFLELPGEIKINPIICRVFCSDPSSQSLFRHVQTCNTWRKIWKRLQFHCEIHVGEQLLTVWQLDSKLSQTSSSWTFQAVPFIVCFLYSSAGTWSFSVSELAAPGVEVGRLTATDPDLGENAQLEFTILDTEEADIFNVTRRGKEAVIVLNKVIDYRQLLTEYKQSSWVQFIRAKLFIADDDLKMWGTSLSSRTFHTPSVADRFWPAGLYSEQLMNNNDLEMSWNKTVAHIWSEISLKAAWVSLCSCFGGI